MKQITEFFSRLLDTSDWPPRWICGEWSDFHGWLYICSDVAIWLAYFIIPVIIIWFIQRKPNFPFLHVFWLFGAFILLCGATHLIDASDGAGQRLQLGPERTGSQPHLATGAPGRARTV